MADPVTIMIAATAITSAVGSISQGQTASRIADVNAQNMEQQARTERLAAKAEEEDFRREQSRLLARQRALVGGSGTTMSGSPLLVAEDIATETELQALRIRYGGTLNSNALTDQAALERAGGRAAKRAGFFRAGSSLLAGAGEMDWGTSGTTLPHSSRDRIPLFTQAI